MRLSSIFSFETYWVSWRVAPGLLVALVLLTAVEVGIARQDWVWGYVPRSQGGVLDGIEKQVIAHNDNAQVIFLGSSRVRDAIAPRQLERELGLAEGAVLNLAVTDGTPFDALYTYRRNRDKLKDAKLAVFGVEVFQFDANFRVNERVLRLASLPERMSMYDGRREETLDLVVGWLWRTYDARKPLRRLEKSLRTGKGREPLEIAADGRIVWTHRARTNRPASTRAKKYFRKFRASKGRQKILETLIREMQADGVDVVLVQVPTRKGFWSHVKKRYPKGRRRYYKTIKGARTRTKVPFWRWEDAAEAGMTNRDFYDWGHATPKGAAKFTTLIAERLLDERADSVARAVEAAPAPKRERTSDRKE